MDEYINKQELIAKYGDWYTEEGPEEGFIGTIKDVAEMMPSADVQPVQRWIPCSERMPICEQEVLICTERKPVGQHAYIDSIITPAIYEDGTMRENDSKWSWQDVDYEEWDEEEDCGIIPEGWFENRHFNPDDVYNNPVDRKVVAWMPLPKPFKDGEQDG